MLEESATVTAVMVELGKGIYGSQGHREPLLHRRCLGCISISHVVTHEKDSILPSTKCPQLSVVIGIQDA